jgi:hypothetical protein
MVQYFAKPIIISPCFCGIQKFITVFTKASSYALCWTSSSGPLDWHCVVSDDHAASIFRASPTLALLPFIPPSALFTLKMEAARSSETSVSYRITTRHMSEDYDMNPHRRENLKSRILTCWIQSAERSVLILSFCLSKWSHPLRFSGQDFVHIYSFPHAFQNWVPRHCAFPLKRYISGPHTNHRKYLTSCLCMSRGSSVSIETRPQAGQSGFNSL